MKNAKKPSGLQATAIHEAAHLVLAVVYGLRFGDVSIVPDRKLRTLGTCVVWNPLLGWKRGDGSRRVLVDHYVEVLHAGGLAEEMLLSIEATGTAGDENAAAAALRDLPPSGATFAGDDVCDRHEARLRKRARRAVARFEPEIRAFAAVLVKKRKLTADEADDAITRILQPVAA